MRDIFFRTPFATSGDTAAIPVAVSPSGSVSFTQGWGPDYQRDLASDPLAKPVSRQDMNYLFKQVTSVLSRWQSEAIPEWIAAADNGGVAMTYAAGTQVRYRVTTGDPFLSYVATEDTATIPGAVGAKWVQTSLGVTAPQFDGTGKAATTAFVQRELGNRSSIIGIGVNTVLTAANAGMIVVTNAPGLNVTLPAASAMRIGATISVQVRNSCTVLAADGIVIGDLPSTTALAMTTSESCDFTSNGVTWYATGGTVFIRPIGVGQTWQNFIGSRAVDTTYTNSTGRPIMVVAGVTTTSVQGTAIITVAGVTIGGSSNYNAGSPQSGVSAIVPPGATYRVSSSAGTATLQSWTELR